MKELKNEKLAPLMGAANDAQIKKMIIETRATELFRGLQGFVSTRALIGTHWLMPALAAN